MSFGLNELNKPSLKLEHGWIINTHIKQWLFMHALILVKSCFLKYFRSRAGMVTSVLSISRSLCNSDDRISNSCEIPVLRNHIMFSKMNSTPESASFTSFDIMIGDKVNNEADLAWCQYEDCLGEFWHYHHIPKTVARPAYLCYGNHILRR